MGQACSGPGNRLTTWLEKTEEQTDKKQLSRGAYPTFRRWPLELGWVDTF